MNFALFAGLWVGAGFFVIRTLPPVGLDLRGWYALGIFSTTCLSWAINLVSPWLTGIVLASALVAFGIATWDQTVALVATPSLLFLVAAFLIGGAIRELGLADEVAVRLVQRFGLSRRRLLSVFFGLAFFTSFLIQEHVVAAILFPIAASLGRARKDCAIAVAWGAVIGGVATHLGGSRAMLAMDLLARSTGEVVPLGHWAAIGVPFALTVGVGAWLLLVLFVSEPEPKAEVEIPLPPSSAYLRPSSEVPATEKAWRAEPRAWAGRPAQDRRLAVLILGSTSLAWLFLSRTWGPHTIGFVGAALLLASGLVSWRALVRHVPWSVVALYAGAIAVGQALTTTDAAAWLGAMLRAHTSGFSPLTLLAAWSGLSLLHTELVMSNAATVSSLLPVALTTATPALSARLMTYAIAFPAGLAFVLPVGTPAVALIISKGGVRVRDLVKAGLVLKLFSWIVIIAFLAWLKGAA
jgi:sodium-dependent dicarboxylate transporter 2/3/5